MAIVSFNIGSVSYSKEYQTSYFSTDWIRSYYTFLWLGVCRNWKTFTFTLFVQQIRWQECIHCCAYWCSNLVDKGCTKHFIFAFSVEKNRNQHFSSTNQWAAPKAWIKVKAHNRYDFNVVTPDAMQRGPAPAAVSYTHLDVYKRQDCPSNTFRST